MAIPASIAKLYETGDAWLANCSPHPHLVREAWDIEALAPIASGEHWLVAEMTLVATVKMLDRTREKHRGPVLSEPDTDKAWWLIPPAAPEELANLPNLTLHPPGWALHCPPTGWHLEGRLWLLRPDGSGRLTEPLVLAAAFGACGYRTRAGAKA